MLDIRTSLYHTFLSSVIGAALLMAVGIGYFRIEFEQSNFAEDARILRDSYVADQKSWIKNVVGQMVAAPPVSAKLSARTTSSTGGIR